MRTNLQNRCDRMQQGNLSVVEILLAAGYPKGPPCSLWILYPTATTSSNGNRGLFGFAGPNLQKKCVTQRAHSGLNVKQAES
jgi:hypothetical protein